MVWWFGYFLISKENPFIFALKNHLLKFSRPRRDLSEGFNIRHFSIFVPYPYLPKSLFFPKTFDITESLNGGLCGRKYQFNFRIFQTFFCKRQFSRSLMDFLDDFSLKGNIYYTHIFSACVSSYEKNKNYFSSKIIISINFFLKFFFF